MLSLFFDRGSSVKVEHWFLWKLTNTFHDQSNLSCSIVSASDLVDIDVDTDVDVDIDVDAHVDIDIDIYASANLVRRLIESVTPDETWGAGVETQENKMISVPLSKKDQNKKSHERWT